MQNKKQKPIREKKDKDIKEVRKKEKIRTVPTTKKEIKPLLVTKVKLQKMKLFGRWDNEIEVLDQGLKAYICLKPVYLPKSSGVLQKHRFYKSNMHIVERLALHLLVPGHTGKRHRLSSGKLAGNASKTLSIVEKSFEIIEKKENKNPIEVLVRSIENSALREEITSYQLGSIIARDAVITSPQRRVDRALRNISHGAYKSSFNSKKSIENALAEELLFSYQGSAESFAIKEKERIEREAVGSR